MMTSESIWTTADGRLIKLRDLTDIHLANVIDWVRLYESDYPVDLLPVLLEEAVKRELSGNFLDRAQIPWQNSRGEWIVGLKVVGRPA